MIRIGLLPSLGVNGGAFTPFFVLAPHKTHADHFRGDQHFFCGKSIFWRFTMRRKQSPVSDRKWFRMTADRTRKINSSPYVPRGGIRL